MNRPPFSENPNGSYYYHGSTLYFVNTAGQVIQLESYDTKADARQMCQHRNSYLGGVGCGATELSEGKIPKQDLPEELDREAYLKLFSEFMPFEITSQDDYDIVQRRLDSIIDKKDHTAEDVEYMSILGSVIRFYEDCVLKISI